MKFLSSLKWVLPVFLVAYASLSEAKAASYELKVQAFSMTAKDAAEFMLAYNPTGQADYSMQQLQKWVEEKRAVNLGSVVVKSESGLHADVSGSKFSVETEAMVLPDAGALDIPYRIKFPDQTITGSVASSLASIVFAGNSVVSNPSDATATVYLIYLSARAFK